MIRHMSFLSKMYNNAQHKLHIAPVRLEYNKLYKKHNSFKLQKRYIIEREGKISETYNIYSAETFSFR